MSSKEVFSHEEAVEIIKRFRVLAGVTLLVLLLGTVFYHFVEDLRWLDAVYFSVVSLLTVGYGDFTPQTDLGKIFTIFYLICGVGILASFVNILVKRTIAKQQLRRKEDSK